MMNLFAKDGDVATGILVVFLGVERAAFDADEMVASTDFAGVNFVGCAVIGHFLQHVWRHVLVRQILQSERIELQLCK